MDKIYLEFQRPWWNGDWGGINFVQEQSSKKKEAADDWRNAILGFYTVRNQPNLLEGWVSGSSARFAENLPESELLHQCSELLKRIVEQDFNYTEPTGLIRTTWFNNPFFRGSYSFRSKQTKQHNVWASDLADPVFNSKGYPQLFFAGEATHSHYYSTVHAAVESGWREADRILMWTKARVESKM